MAAETQYTANTGMVTISTANTNLDGTGTLGTVITGASNGTLVKTVTIKSQGTLTAQGIVRLFVYDGTNTKFIKAFPVDALTITNVSPSFGITIPMDLALKSGWSLKASTEKNQTFNVIAEGLDWAYYTTSVRPESTNYTANTGMATISTANTALDGSGTIVDVLTAASNGTLIKKVTIKAQVTTGAAQVRLFLYDGTNTKLLVEIPVLGVTKAATVESFSTVFDFDGEGFALKSGWKLRAATQLSDTFNIIAEGLDWTYPA